MKPIQKAVCRKLVSYPNHYCGSWDGLYHYEIKAGKGWFPLSFSRKQIYNGTAANAIKRMSAELNDTIPFTMTKDESLANQI